MKKINKKIIIGVALLIFVIIGFIVVKLTESDDLQDVNIGSSTRNVYENYTGETIKVDDEVKKQVDSMIVEKRTEAIENKETNIEHIPVSAEYIELGEGTNINDFFKNEFIPCVTSEYDENGFHCKTGFNKEGFNRDGYDINGFGEDGCNKEGYNILGDRCEGYEEPEVDDCIDGVDEFGNLCGDYAPIYDDAPIYDENGCDENMLNREGEYCLEETEEAEEPATVVEAVQEVVEVDPICLTEEECRERQRWDVSLSAEERVWYENRLSNKINKLGEMLASEAPASFSIRNQTDFKTYVEPVEELPPNDNDDDDKGYDPDRGYNEDVQIPTGTTLNAKLEADINSDYGGTVRASIVGGKLHGAKLIGSFDVPFIDNVHLPRDKVSIRFDRLVYNRETFSIDAIGVDAETMNDYVGGKVNRHYLLRWGGLVSSTFLKGLGESISQGSVRTAGDGSNNLVYEPIKGTKNQMKVALGEVGGELAQHARDQFTRPPTVTIKKNSSRGSSFPIIFMNEVVDDRLPMIFSRAEQQEINRRRMLNPGLFD